VSSTTSFSRQQQRQPAASSQQPAASGSGSGSGSGSTSTPAAPAAASSSQQPTASTRSSQQPAASSQQRCLLVLIGLVSVSGSSSAHANAMLTRFTSSPLSWSLTPAKHTACNVFKMLLRCPALLPTAVQVLPWSQLPGVAISYGKAHASDEQQRAVRWLLGRTACRPNQDSRCSLRKAPLFSQLFLCLSRVCLGKRIVFT
jgi:hypothetical protein